MSLARHTTANREFFEKGNAPAMATWVDWIKRGVIRGKVVDGKPWVDLNWFACHEVMEPMPEASNEVTAMDLLS
jgi:hypothetical protein